MVLSSIVFVILAIIVGVWYFIQRHLSFFERHGIPGLPVSMPAGNLQGVGSKMHFCELMQKYYMENKHRGLFLGLYFFLMRVVLVTDLDLVRNILIKDAHLFKGRSIYYNEADDPLSAHLFALSGSKWKQLRVKLTPTFTSGKMKYMLGTVLAVSDKLSNRFAQATAQPRIEIKDIWARYSTDVIGSCAFGIECNTLHAENTHFREIGRMFFEEPRHGLLFQNVLNQSKKLGNLLRIKQLPSHAAAFFMKIVKDTIRYREANTGARRKDFMSILIDLKNNPSIALTEEEIAAQALIFFLAGFETSSSLLSFCTYELAIHQDIQERARREVHEVLARHNGELTYEALSELPYCDQVLNESLRKYPPLATLTRNTDKDYPIPGTKLTIPGGTGVVIPVYAIQHDPEIYPDPEQFDPERFTPDQVADRHSAAFLPFGDGPHNCIGIRFGVMQARIGLATILRDYHFTLDARMSIPLKLAKQQVIIASEEGIWIHLKRV